MLKDPDKNLAIKAFIFLRKIIVSQLLCPNVKCNKQAFSKIFGKHISLYSPCATGVDITTVTAKQRVTKNFII